MGCFGLIVHLAFWGLLWHGRDKIGLRWKVGLVLLYALGWWGSRLLPGGPYFFLSLLALIDIVLVLVVFEGDVRIT